MNARNVKEPKTAKEPLGGFGQKPPSIVSGIVSSGVAFSNLRGVCTHIDILTDGEDGSDNNIIVPPISNLLAYFKNQNASYPMQFNFLRLGFGSWDNALYGGTYWSTPWAAPGPPWNGTLVPITSAQYWQNWDTALNALDQAGIAFTLNGAWLCKTQLLRQWLDNTSANWQAFYTNGLWPAAADAKYQGMNIWDAVWDYTGTLLTHLEPHPSFRMMKFDNEPGVQGQLSWASNPNAVLHTMGNWFAQKMRSTNPATGSPYTSKPIIFQCESESPAATVSAMQTAAPDAIYSPLGYSVHYPTVAQAGTINSAIVGGQIPGCTFWYDDEENPSNTSGLASTFKLLGVAMPLMFDFRTFSMLDGPTILPASGAKSPVTVSQTYLSQIGAAQFF